MTKENINDIVTQYFLRDIIDFIPMKSKVKRKAIEGIIQKKIPESELKTLSLNECLNFEENNRIIEYFIKVLERKFSHCNLSALYENISTLKIHERNKSIIEKLDELLSLKKSGYYSEHNNSIRIYPDENKSEILSDSTKSHELLHMATSRKIGNIRVCGFARYGNGIDFARGLNEGYTEYLNRKYFTRRIGGAYQALQSIALGIERLVGQEQMEKFYFSNDLDGLISEMEKFATRESILKLVQKVDYINSFYGKPGGKYIQNKLSREARVDIANMTLKKYQQTYKTGQMPEEEYKANLFSLECYTHNYLPFYWRRKGNDKFEKVALSNSICFEPIIEVSTTRYKEIVEEYYESKKDNLRYTSTPWQNKNGLGIEETIIREKNIQTIVKLEESKGRKQEEVTAEINKMLSESPSQIPVKNTILKQW